MSKGEKLFVTSNKQIDDYYYNMHPEVEDFHQCQRGGLLEVLWSYGNRTEWDLVVIDVNIFPSI